MNSLFIWIAVEGKIPLNQFKPANRVKNKKENHNLPFQLSQQ